ncbi:MAG: transaldolase family protein [Sedimentisphaeraceae bacterium JB056]
MRIYGAGSVEEVKKCSELGVVGILTNPQGFDQYFGGKMTLEEITKSLVEVTDLPVFIQIHAETAEGLVDRARQLHAISPQVGFKIISDVKGFEAIRQLQKEGIDCIATCLFSLSQASVAATVGAFGICPFVSRARAIGMDPFAILRDIKQGYSQLERAPEIIAVSLKGVGDIDLALAAGVDSVGMRYPAIEEMMQHPLSKNAETLFAKNWANIVGEDVSYIDQSKSLGGEAE